MKAVAAYNQPAVTVPATGSTPVLLTPTSGNWDFVNIPNTSVQTIFIRCQHFEATAPDDTQLTSAAGWTFQIPAQSTLTLSYGPGVAIYAVLAAGSADIEINTGVFDGE